ncbi:uncharacterized protein LOC103316385 isoform X2 [Nasonia vitripennis]|uniref:WD repeat-containing protein on Y chromosome n=1 Tax=Nasonia vitripennis TaxID=7425 RepID=A0A7M7PXY3_NASVI|nr:uncharacterized protein LOC103316385 isoform X2 [Nasonia vitripennis]
MASGREECFWRAKLRVMNERFKSRLDENVFEGVREPEIHHGLRPAASTLLHGVFTDMCFCDETQEYLLLDRGVEIQRYSMQGKLLRPSFSLEPTQTFSRVQWFPASRPSSRGCLVCHEPEAENIWILGRSGDELQCLKNEFYTKALYHEPSRNELVVVGSHQTTKYSLDDKEQTERELESSKALAYSDPEFGPTWQLDCSALIPQTALPARLVASYLTTLYLMPLEVDADSVSEGPVEFLGKRSNASKAPISAIHFHASTSWIILGDQLGNVVAWNLKFECVMSHTGAHSSKLTLIVSHPSICGFLSCGLLGDKLQVWSCNFRDKIESFDQLGVVKAITVNEKAATVVTLGTGLDYLTMRQVYCFFAPLTSKARSLMSTSCPMYPTRVIAASEDNSVRMFSSCGKQLNLQILPEDDLHVVAAVLSGDRKQLFTIILKTGEILVSDASVCPMKFRKVFVNDASKVTCITVYEHFDEIRDSDGHPKKPRIFYPISILVIAGTEEGNLIVLNPDTGKPEYVSPAHTASVVQLKSSVYSKRVISLGSERCVKVWRIFADLAKPLALYYVLHFVVPITHVSFMGKILCMANSSENSQVHQVLMEDTADRIRLEHHSSKDHTATIMDMITSETLGLCATSSRDNTVRIWDEENCLIKILVINTCALHITFSSVIGDIVFSAGRHLYKIPHENYLPPKYRAKVVANDLLEEKDEDTILEDSEYKLYDDIVDRNSMLRPVSSIPLASIDIRNADNPRVDLLIQKQICALYQERDEDIKRIKDRLIAPTKIVEDRALMTKETWDKYVNDLLSSMTRPPAEKPDYDFQNIQESKLAEVKTYNERGVFQMLFGYSVDEIDDTENLAELIRDSKLPLNGFLPNSILYKTKELVEPLTESVESLVKEPVKYRYPAKFYMDEDEEPTEARESIRLSQLMAVDDLKNEKEEE